MKGVIGYEHGVNDDDHITYAHDRRHGWDGARVDVAIKQHVAVCVEDVILSNLGGAHLLIRSRESADQGE